jgi:hypothetical protein
VHNVPACLRVCACECMRVSEFAWQRIDHRTSASAREWERARERRNRCGEHTLE